MCEAKKNLRLLNGKSFMSSDKDKAMDPVGLQMRQNDSQLHQNIHPQKPSVDRPSATVGITTSTQRNTQTSEVLDVALCSSFHSILILTKIVLQKTCHALCILFHMRNRKNQQYSSSRQSILLCLICSMIGRSRFSSDTTRIHPRNTSCQAPTRTCDKECFFVGNTCNR